VIVYTIRKPFDENFSSRMKSNNKLSKTVASYDTREKAFLSKLADKQTKVIVIMHD
jgi:hypothetical protein